MIELIKKFYNSRFFPPFIFLIISLLLGYWFTIPDIRLVYEITQNEETFNTSQDSDFKLIYRDSTKISKNIYKTSIELWNEGRLPINKNDIRDTLTFKLLDTTAIILGEIRCKETHPKIIGASIYRYKEKGLFKMDFKFMDNINGIKIEFYYISDSSSQILINTYLTNGKNAETGITSTQWGIFSFFSLLAISISVLCIFISLFVPVSIHTYIIEKIKKKDGLKYRVLRKVIPIFASIMVLSLIFFSMGYIMPYLHKLVYDYFLPSSPF